MDKSDIYPIMTIIAIFVGIIVLFGFSISSEKQACRAAGGVPIMVYGGIINCAKEGFIDVK